MFSQQTPPYLGTRCANVLSSSASTCKWQRPGCLHSARRSDNFPVFVYLQDSRWQSSTSQSIRSRPKLECFSNIGCISNHLCLKSISANLARICCSSSLFEVTCFRFLHVPIPCCLYTVYERWSNVQTARLLSPLPASSNSSYSANAPLDRCHLRLS